MIQAWFLVLVLSGTADDIYYRSNPIVSVTIPQANQKQCEINKHMMLNMKGTRKAFCIVGVLPKAGQQ